MLGFQQWSGEPEAERGSRCRKSEVLGDFEGRQRIGERAKVRRRTAVDDLVHQDGNFGRDTPDYCYSPKKNNSQ